jgi:predicted glycosyltransferase
MGRYVFSSHDGFGLGHTRRNALIAREVARLDPTAEIVLVSGVQRLPEWLDDPRFSVVRVPSLLKDQTGRYGCDGMGLEAAVAERARVFGSLVADLRPDVVVVDRHPFGTAGELRPGLAEARRQGATILLGLRDVLDDTPTVRRELDGPGWRGVRDVYDELLVFGSPLLCDHERDYGLPFPVRYCGWVVERPSRRVRDKDLVVVSAGGGGDGETLFRLGVEALRRRPGLRGVVTAGPYAGDWLRRIVGDDRELEARLEVRHGGGSTVDLFAGAGAVVQMCGYNSTVEALAAGQRAVLVPRRAPRREQAIRAGRLASLGLADELHDTATPEEVAWLLDQPRRLAPAACARAGISFDGAAMAARAVTSRALEAVA